MRDPEISSRRHGRHSAGNATAIRHWLLGLFGAFTGHTLPNFLARMPLIQLRRSPSAGHTLALVVDIATECTIESPARRWQRGDAPRPTTVLPFCSGTNAVRGRLDKVEVTGSGGGKSRDPEIGSHGIRRLEVTGSENPGYIPTQIRGSEVGPVLSPSPVLVSSPSAAARRRLGYWRSWMEVHHPGRVWTSRQRIPGPSCSPPPLTVSGELLPSLRWSNQPIRRMLDGSTPSCSQARHLDALSVVLRLSLSYHT